LSTERAGSSRNRAPPPRPRARSSSTVSRRPAGPGGGRRSSWPPPPPAFTRSDPSRNGGSSRSRTRARAGRRRRGRPARLWVARVRDRWPQRGGGGVGAAAWDSLTFGFYSVTALIVPLLPGPVKGANDPGPSGPDLDDAHEVGIETRRVNAAVVA